MLESPRHLNGNGNGNGHAVPLRRFQRPNGNGSGSNGDDSRELNVALVGLGYWGPNLLRVLADKPDVVRALDLRPGT